MINFEKNHKHSIVLKINFKGICFRIMFFPFFIQMSKNDSDVIMTALFIRGIYKFAAYFLYVSIFSEYFQDVLFWEKRVEAIATQK